MKRLLPVLSVMALCLWTWPSWGASIAHSKHTEVELIPECTTIAPGVPFTVALRMTMDPHWHTYWKNPGDSGLATSIRWELPEGFTAGPIQWPAPNRIEVGGLVSSAYEGEIFLLTEIVPPASLRTGRAATLRARVDWLECEEICIPGKAELTLTLPTGPQSRLNPGRTALFSAARAALPPVLNEPVRIEDRGDHYDVVFEKADPALLHKAHFFAITEDAIEYAGKQTLQTSPRPVRLSIPKAENAKTAVSLEGVLRMERPGGVTYGTLPPTPVVPSKSTGSPTPPAIRSLSSLLFLGFLGGLILNLMPCVFPVLGIKVLGLVQQTGGDRSGIARHGFAYTAGVLVSFWLLAGLLLALREGGSQLGWGFQLQSPAFVFVLTALLLVFGLNMSGVFEIGASMVGAGSDLAGKPSLGGSFFSGVLATVVATPCAAPFLAPALGAALALPAGPALVLFSAIALGLALPYLLLSLFPGMIRLLPRPGVWMESFKQGLAFLLYAAAGYLLWVLFGQISESAQLAAVFGLVGLAAAAWVYGRWSGPAHPARTRVIAAAFVIILGLGGLAGGWPRAEKSGGITWEPWSAERIAALRSEGRPVYVDFTARWCATCQVNKKVVFGSSEVVRTFLDRNVATLKADWTNQDPAITAELARWQRSAVPFNLLYLPGKTEPVVLPEILTPAVVLDSLTAP